MSAATKVIYGSVTLHNVSTQNWDQTVIYDSTNTDPIGKRYNLTFDALVHVEGSPATAPVWSSDGGTYSTGAAALRALTAKLEQPRQRLRVLMGDTTVVDVQPQRAGKVDTYTLLEDIDNGPKPISVKVFRIAGDKAFRVRFTVHATVNNCTAKARIGIAINNRWSVMEAMDENFAIHRTISGMIRLSGSAAANNNIDALAARDLAFPKLEDGFRRQSVSFQASTDGLSLTYQITDRQSRYAAPWPATRMSGTHSEQTADGYRYVSTVSCRLVGPPHCSIPDLIARAVAVTNFRINWNRRLDANTGNAVRILDACIREDIGDDPTIEVGVRVEQIYKDAASIVAKVKNETWGQMKPGFLNNPETPQDDRGNSSSYQINWHYNPHVYGYNEHGTIRNAISSAFLRCVLQGQCGEPAALVDGTKREVSNYGKESDREEATTITEYEQASELDYPDAATTWSESHLDAMYLAVKHGTEMHWSQPMAQLPVAKASSGSGPTATLVKLCEPTSLRVVQVDYERYGKPPEIPSWGGEKMGEANLAPLKLIIKTPSPKLSEDGDTLLYRIVATYTYYADRQLSLIGKVPVGQLPMLSQEVAEPELNLGSLFNPSLPQ